MKTHTKILAGMAILLLGASTSSVLAQSEVLPMKLAPHGVYVDAQGNVVEKSVALAAPKAKALTGSPATACLQLHLGGTVFNFNLNIDADTYPYHVTGGAITGGICGAPWHVTGGTLGSSLTINGAINTPHSGCANTISVVGNANTPSGYAGTYGFDGSSTMFSHHTLFLGFQKSTCP